MQMLSEEENEKRAARRRLESEMVILQSDGNKIRRQAEDIAVEIRRISDNIKRLELDIQTKEAARRKLDTDKMLNETEIARLKKRMNLL
jgi:hypothetical protein